MTVRKPVLPREVRERLGRELRLALQETEPAPAYLGDPALPADFEDLVHRFALSVRRREAERARSLGLAAIEAAIGNPDPRAKRRGLEAVQEALEDGAAERLGPPDDR
jgi:hypothetical protein